MDFDQYVKYRNTAKDVKVGSGIGQVSLYDILDSILGDGLFVNAKSFDVIGDDVADDTEKIQEALDSFPEQGGVLFFPSGTYLITQSLIFPETSLGSNIIKPIVILGAGGHNINGSLGGYAEGITTFHYTGSGAMFELRNGDESQTDCLASFVNFSAYGEDVAESIGLNAYMAKGARYENVLFSHFGTGLKTNAIYYGKWDAVRTHYCTTGVDITGDINGTTFFRGNHSSCTIGFNTSFSGTAINFVGTWFEHNETGIKGRSAAQYTFTGCYFEDNSSYNVDVAEISVSEPSVLNLIGTFMNINDLAGYGLRTVGRVYVNITGLYTYSEPNVIQLIHPYVDANHPEGPAVTINGWTQQGTLIKGIKPTQATGLFVSNSQYDEGIQKVNKLGIGNAEAATTPGSVTNKIEIFDTDDVSLGFVPIYDAIT
jgi:hypothetical protein